MSKKLKKIFGIMLFLIIAVTCVRPGLNTGQTATAAAPGVHLNRFMELFNDIQTKGYLSPEGVPYYSVETLMVETPVDYGHLTTSDTISYLTWLGATYGAVTGDWTYYTKAWNLTEQYIIPSVADQPGIESYDPNNPAPYIPEAGQPRNYPVNGVAGFPTGIDPIGNELASSYGMKAIYQMNRLVDVDNWHKFGKRGDGTSRFSYIDLGYRGVLESVWETVPHPCWEDFKWGMVSHGGFLPLYIQNIILKQWNYTTTSGADARQIQAAYWAYEWSKGSGGPYFDKAAKLGDFLRYTMFDKYFRPIGVQSGAAQGTGYDSCHFLLAWRLSWGAIPDGGWSWRTGSYHVHQGYQNPVAAYALANVPEFAPRSPNARRDWSIGLQRQIELYQYLQSAEGAIAGGITNSWDGRYFSYPAGVSTFYMMAYDPDPIYHDPPGNRWFGYQAWSMERVAEYCYLSGDVRAKLILDKWVTWALSQTSLNSNGTYLIPAALIWSGQPDPWTGTPSSNNNLHCMVQEYNDDVGVAASYAKVLIYYAAAYAKWSGVAHQAAKDMAEQLLDRMWFLYRDNIGVANPENRADYSRFFDEVYIPTGFTGINGQGAQIRNGMTFIDLRRNYQYDPQWCKVNSSGATGLVYHRFWAQAEIAMANALYYIYFPVPPATPTPTVALTITPTPTPTRRAATPTPTVRTMTPTPTMESYYVVFYVIQSDWGVGAAVSITIFNHTTTAVNGWTLAWTYSSFNEFITDMWGASYKGVVVSAEDAGWNANIAPNGGSVNFGFCLNYSGLNPTPTDFKLNGVPCRVL